MVATRDLIDPFGARRIVPRDVPKGLLIEMRTLETLNVSRLPELATYENAQILR